MIKIFKNNKGEIFLLNSDFSGIRLSDGYWRFCHDQNKGKWKEIKNLIINNSNFYNKGNQENDKKILVPKIKFNIPHFILLLPLGSRLITNKKFIPPRLVF